MNKEAQLLLDQSIKTLVEALHTMDEGYNKIQLQEVLDEFRCVMNNLE